MPKSQAAVSQPGRQDGGHVSYSGVPNIFQVATLCPFMDSMGVLYVRVSSVWASLQTAAPH